MPLQNRVDPFGAIHAVASRGLFTGNRGVIHDPARRVLTRRWASKAWIICACSYKDRTPRDVMGYNGRKGGVGWTELFFLDEVTALAAGHRPCFTCRREEAKCYQAAMAAGLGLAGRPPAPEMDRLLHATRHAVGAPPRPLPHSGLAGLPDGAMVEAMGRAFALRSGRLIEWSFDGWKPVDEPPGSGWHMITPAATLAALAAGYGPVWHDSALT